MNEQRAREGVEHLQAAALEVIAAVRAFLDVAEDVVRDPAQVTAVVQDLAETGKQAAAAAASAAAAAGTAAAASAAAASGGGGAGPKDAGGDGVTRIRVS